MASSNFLRQLSLEAPFDLFMPQTESITKDAYSKELLKFRESLLQSSPIWPKQLNTVASPLPTLIPGYLEKHLENLGNYICRAVTSIVERWWSDKDARFWERMPLLEHQEEVLRWIDGPGSGVVEPFARKKGSWRPDFLLNFLGNSLPGDPRTGAVQICEINARFAFNGFWITAFAHEAFQKKLFKNLHLRSPVDPEQIFAAYEGLINVNKPVHLLMGQEEGLDIHLFSKYLENRLGLRVRFIQPSDLRLVPYGNSKSSHMVCCIATTIDFANQSEDFKSWRLISKDGEILEQVFQVGLELHQREMEDLGVDMLKALAPICFNDLRTIYLVHDKRMLGIVLQELDALVQRHHVLSAEEAEVLRNGIVPTAIAGSEESRALLQLAKLGLVSKDNYILKPIGSGKGKGIMFASEIESTRWISLIQRLSVTPNVEGQNYVVQRRVLQPQFKVVIPADDTRSEEMDHFFIGTFMMINGVHLGIGCWRSSTENICAVSRGGSWMCSLMLDDSRRTISSITASNIPRIVVPSLGSSKHLLHVQEIHNTLHKCGILLLSLNFSDPRSEYLLNLVHALNNYHSHGPPLSHSATCGYFWDVRPTPIAVSIPYLARSQTKKHFPWHTDCSYANEPPRFFGLHVLQADRRGGGTLSVLQLTKVLQRLRKMTVVALCAKEYKIEIPPEFANGIDSIVGSVLSREALGFFEKNGEFETIELEPRIRFRADILTPLTARAAKALDELNGILTRARDDASDMCLNLNPSLMPNGTIVLLDNGRWLHARNQVNDDGRHLRRIRWDAREFKGI